MVFSERDPVIYREGGTGPPRHGVVIGTGRALDEVYFVEIPKTNGRSDCVTASENELKEAKKKYIVAQEHELEKEKR